MVTVLQDVRRQMIILNILVDMRSSVRYIAQVGAYLQHHYESNILIDGHSAYSASAIEGDRISHNLSITTPTQQRHEQGHHQTFLTIRFLWDQI